MRNQQMTNKYEMFKNALLEAVETSVGADEPTKAYNDVTDAIKVITDDLYGEYIGHMDDVIVVAVPTENSNEFIKQIDETPNVFGYEVGVDDDNASREYITIYIDPAIVMFDADETMTEARFVTKFNSKNLRKRKYLCQPGYKHNNDSGACEKIGGLEKMDRRLGTRHAIITKKRQGNSLKLRTKIKATKAKKYRKQAGF